MEEDAQESSSPGHVSSEHPPSSRTDVSPRSAHQGDTAPQNGNPTGAASTEDPKAALEDFDWIELEKRHLSMMEERKVVEDEIYEEFNDLVDMFNAWTSATAVHDTDRAHKRLRTRIAFVQSAESKIEERRQHHLKVVQAFENALALLGGP